MSDVAMLAPAEIEALGRVHGPRQGAPGSGLVLNAAVIARALMRGPSVTAAVTPPSDAAPRARSGAALVEGVAESVRVVDALMAYDGAVVAGWPVSGAAVARVPCAALRATSGTAASEADPSERRAIAAVVRVLRDAADHGLPVDLAEAFRFPGEWRPAFDEIEGLAADRPSWAAAWSGKLASLGARFAGAQLSAPAPPRPSGAGAAPPGAAAAPTA